MKGWTVGCVLLLALAIFNHVDAGVLQKRFRRGRVGLPPPRRPRSNSIVVETLNFTQLQDHFEPTNENTWNQKYYASSSYFKTGGPVFIFISGEAPADIGWSEEGAWIVYAKKYKAMMFQLEHRFYGDSQPTSDVSVDSLRYLTSEQALADVATFVVGMNEKYGLPSDTKWIAFGGSYAGNLAAWVRYKYPHLIHGAQASSAPVLAKVDFYEFMNVVKTSLATFDYYKKGCTKYITQANQQLIKALKTSNGRKNVEELFNLCSPINETNTNDVINLFNIIAIAIDNAAQYNDVGYFEETITYVCEGMTGYPFAVNGTALERLAEVFNGQSTVDCLDFSYDGMISNYSKTSWEAVTDGGRQWTYQTCVEFGYYQTSETKTEFFAQDLPLEWFLQQCIDIFGKNFTKQEIYDAVNKTNTIYGGTDIQATRVVYVNGNLDPWHALGITETKLAASPAIYINGTAHCADMYPANDIDPSGLIAARKKITKLIGKWLKED